MTEDRYPLSPMQKGMLFHQLFEPHSGADLEQMVMRFHESIDRDRLATAWEAVSKRHEVLRTSFLPGDEGEPVQVVHNAAPMQIVTVDQAAYNQEQAEERLQEFLRTDRYRGFDPEVAPLSRLTVFERGENSAVLVWSFHHIILDGRSFPIVLADFFAAYDALASGVPIELEPSIPYRKFIQGLAELNEKPAHDYWRKTLAGFTAPTPLMVEGIGGVPKDSSGFGEVTLVLESELTRSLERFAEQNQVTMNTTLQGAWSLLLARYSGESDVVFGATRSGRYGVLDGANTMAGLFINTLPMRVSVPSEASLGDWLRDLRAQHIALRDFEQIPLVEVQALSEIPSGTRLFDSILVFENYQLDPMMRSRTGTGDRVDYELLEQTNHPLLLSVYGGSQLELRLEYDRSLFDRAVAERMVGHVASFLRAMTESGAELVGDLDCVDQDEFSAVVSSWNRPSETGPSLDVISAWRQRAAIAPTLPAVVCPGCELTAAELDRRSDALASSLTAGGIGTGQFVGILLDRSPEAIVAMLGVLKSGAAYLPLDPGYPVDRLQYMLEDSNVSVVVTDGETWASGGLAPVAEQSRGLKPLYIDKAEPVGDPPLVLPTVDESTPAYIIYTSGSTGKPKGVVISHGSLANHAGAMIEAYDLTTDDRVLQFAALSFDVAAEEIFPTLLAGAAVILRSEDVATSFEELDRIVDEFEVTVLNLPAAYWSTWLDSMMSEPDPSLPEAVRLVITGSEKVSTDDYLRWVALTDSSVRWLNAYGPTEATITASIYDPAGADPPPGPIMPIGRPIANVSFYVLDEQGRPTPIGVPGELHIGGRGVAIGYHRRPDLTAEKFVDDPFLEGTGARCYRTGDLARWLPDGTVEFLGRVDDQVKIRGFRIELREIEAALRDLEGVAQAAVVAQPDSGGMDQLLAHLVPENVRSLDLAAIRTQLEERLPSYMVPIGYGTVDALPITPSGKIDRSALPVIKVETAERSKVPPRTDLERRMAAVWAEVLGTSDVGVHDNFFDIGGNSLSAIRLFSAIREMTGRRMQLPELFAAPSIAQLAAMLGDGEPHGAADGQTAEGQVLPSWVFPVKSSGSLPPLFHLGGASVLRHLAKYFPDEQPVYALLEQDIDADHFHTSVEEIVEHCVRGLRAAQPEGPYLVGGLCFGGVVALEISRRLIEEGQEVALTAMIDSFAPGAVDANQAADRQAEATQPVIEHSSRLRTYGLAKIKRKIRRRLWRRVWGPLHGGFKRFGRPMPAWLRDVEEANTIASDSYNARAYPGDVLLIKAADNSDDLDGGAYNGWDRYIDGELQVVEVVGGHVSMYQEPNVTVLATELLQAIERAHAGRG